MMKLWGRNNSINVQKAVWACVEAGVEFERIDVGGAFGRLDEPDYLAKNPNGRIPTLEDGDLVLWESNVIVRYVAARYAQGSLCPAGVDSRALAEQWMDWEQSTLMPPMTTVFWNLVRYGPEQRDMAAVEAARETLLGRWGILDRHLAERDYVLGDAFTMADIPPGAAAYRWFAMDLERPSMPALEAWHARLRARPAYRENVMLPLT